MVRQLAQLLGHPQPDVGAAREQQGLRIGGIEPGELVEGARRMKARAGVELAASLAPRCTQSLQPGGALRVGAAPDRRLGG